MMQEGGSSGSTEVEKRLIDYQHQYDGAQKRSGLRVSVANQPVAFQRTG